ncbi:GNAT family N-acetyltransferase [Floridanema aerugineum]|uniref:GNAT family N-acetyltransferase n=1 Tax=Floridaenema aerugineum BLCC-F46 TaxID=3153654 RepID=A0ABV4XFC1_9CYAN
MKIIELLTKTHNRTNFDCGNEALNRYLQQTARQHQQKGIARTWVLIDSEQPSTIIGYLSLTLCEIRGENLPERWVKKYPQKVPGIKLARLAVDRKWQRKGIGEILMVEAMRKAFVVAETAGGIGLFVDAKDEKAKNYYSRYGFENLENSELEMFLPLSTIESLIQGGKENS